MWVHNSKFTSHVRSMYVEEGVYIHWNSPQPTCSTISVRALEIKQIGSYLYFLFYVGVVECLALE